MNIWPNNHIIAGCLIVLFTFTNVFAEEGLDVTALQGIYGGESPSKVEQTAMTHLQAGLQKVYGIHLPLLTSPQDRAGKKLIVLGKRGVISPQYLLVHEMPDVPDDGFAVYSNTRGVVISGDNSWAVLDGVYRFLAENGMHFFLPQFEKASVSKNTSGKIPILSLTEKPDFSYRSGRSTLWGQMYYQLGDPRNGLNPELFDKKKTGSDLWIDHTAGYLVPKTLYYHAHPEYYAMKNGRRISPDRFSDHRTPLCLSNTDVKRISIERALGWIQREPDKRFFMITYGDTGVWCDCSECQKLDVHRGILSDRLLNWVNPIARAVKEKFPDRILMTFAYSEADLPPLREVPEDNVWVVGSTGLGSIPFWDHAWKKGTIPQHHLNKIDGWLKVAPHQYALCEYQSNNYKPALVDTLAARLRFYRDRGIRGIAFTYGLPKNFRGLWEYLYSHLMWDLEQDAMRQAHDYINYYFKNAAPYINRIFTLSHERYDATLAQKLPLVDSYPEGFYSTAYTTAISQSFAAAADAVIHDEKLFNEIRQEEQFFIFDWMRHPEYSGLDDTARALLMQQMERLLILSGENDTARTELGRELHRIALAVDDSHSGTREEVEQWILKEKLHTTMYEKRPNGVVLLPESFQFSGYGPSRYGYNCPPMDAAGIYVKGNSKYKSHRMIAEFDWEHELVDENSDITLTLTGQVASTGLTSPTIRILINGVEVYSGSADFVENNWSSQEYGVPAGVMKKRANLIEIENLSNPLSIIRWNQRWCLIARAEILLRKKVRNE